MERSKAGQTGTATRLGDELQKSPGGPSLHQASRHSQEGDLGRLDRNRARLRSRWSGGVLIALPRRWTGGLREVLEESGIGPILEACSIPELETMIAEHAPRLLIVDEELAEQLLDRPLLPIDRMGLLVLGNGPEGEGWELVRQLQGDRFLRASLHEAIVAAHAQAVLRRVP